jgi:hypothetical protein
MVTLHKKKNTPTLSVIVAEQHKDDILELTVDVQHS